MEQFKIRILPSEQLHGCSDCPDIFPITSNTNMSLQDILNSEYSLFNSGREGIRAILENIKPKIDDEIYITTTKNTTYVPSCVSSTIFNYCKISRVLSEKTIAIFLIHTYAFPHPKLLELKKYSVENNIPLIEDCISSFNSINAQGIRLGSIGDYAVYSLSKILPIKFGGLVTWKKNRIKGINNPALLKDIKKWTPRLDDMKIRKQQNYLFLEQFFKNDIYSRIENVDPFMYGFQISNSQTFMSDFKSVEFGLTHVNGEIHIPTNPFITSELYRKCLNIGKKNKTPMSW